MKWIAVVALLLAAPVAKPWTPPRTPWGDPDLQGTYANNNEYATPLERPAEFDGKRASDLTAAEGEARRRSDDDRAHWLRASHVNEAVADSACAAVFVPAEMTKR